MPVQYYDFAIAPSLNSQSNLTVCIRNNPPLGSISLYWITSRDSRATTVKAIKFSEPPDEIFCSSNAIFVRNSNDYANYTLTFLHNSRGSKSFIFEVVQPASPNSPINFKVVNCSSRTAFFTWTAGFSGIANSKQQTFYILYRKWQYSDSSGAPQLSNVSVLEANSSLTIGLEKEICAAQLDGLESNTRYMFALYSTNKNGLSSNLSEAATCTTKRMPLKHGGSKFDYA